MTEYVEAASSILNGIPWTLESAQAAGYQTLEAAHSRQVKFAHFLDDEEVWLQLQRDFEQAVEELSNVWGPPVFRLDATGELFQFFGDLTERVAGWDLGEHTIYVKLCCGDNTRVRILEVGVRLKKLLPRPPAPQDWWDQPPWQPGA